VTPTLASVDDDIDRVRARLLNAAGAERIRDGDADWLARVWMVRRYELAETRVFVEGAASDYCTLLLCALAKTAMASGAPEDLGEALDALAATLSDSGLDVAAFDQRPGTQAWYRAALWRVSDAWPVLRPAALPAFTDCVRTAMCAAVGAVRRWPWAAATGETPEAEPVDGWSLASGEASIKFADDVEPWLCGMAAADAYATEYTEGTTPCAALSCSTRDRIVRWLTANAADVDFDDYTTLFINQYIEHSLLPGECYQYHKVELLRPNSPREALEIIRKEAFQEALLLCSEKPADVLAGRPVAPAAAALPRSVLARGTMVAAIVAAVSGLVRDAGIDLTRSFASYSQWECYGRDHVRRLTRPCVLSVAGFFVAVPELSLGLRTVTCADVVEALHAVVTFATTGSSPNRKAVRLIRDWEEGS